MEAIELRTSRLILTPPNSQDVDAIYSACQDAELQRRVPIPVPYRRTDAESFIRDHVGPGWASGEFCTWAIRLDGVFCGIASLDSIRDGTAEVGYWLASTARNRKLMSEALVAIVDYAFAVPSDGLSLTRLSWWGFAGNIASARVAAKAGFRFEGTRRLAMLGRNGLEDVWAAGLLREDDRSAPINWPVLDH